MMKKLPVFYRPEMSCAAATGVSPSAGKPKLAVEDWLAHPHIGPHIQIETFNPATDEILCGAHHEKYVDGVLSGELLNGFGTRDPDIAASLRYTVGSMVAAAKHVLTMRGRYRFAVSPTSGFHHAGYRQGGGFCTFNGLMAAAIRVHTLGLAERILIIDMDGHYGDGTDDIIKTLGIDYVDHITACKSYDTANEALDCIWKQFRQLGERHYSLVLYQAGADIHVDDPLGAGIMTEDEMIHRDYRVFAASVVNDTPVVWNLAGGYARDAQGTIEPVLKLHRNTMAQCLRMAGLRNGA